MLPPPPPPSPAPTLLPCAGLGAVMCNCVLDAADGSMPGCGQPRWAVVVSGVAPMLDASVLGAGKLDMSGEGGAPPPLFPPPGVAPPCASAPPWLSPPLGRPSASSADRPPVPGLSGAGYTGGPAGGMAAGRVSRPAGAAACGGGASSDTTAADTAVTELGCNADTMGMLNTRIVGTGVARYGHHTT